MPLASVLQTALTGMTAAEVTIGAVAHNLANLQTPGYKQSFPALATLPPAAPVGADEDVGAGAGVQIVGMDVDQQPGPLVISATGSVVELSNTDIGRNLVTSILASTQFRLSVEVATTADALLDDLTQLARR